MYVKPFHLLENTPQVLFLEILPWDLDQRLQHKLLSKSFSSPLTSYTEPFAYTVEQISQHFDTYLRSAQERRHQQNSLSPAGRMVLSGWYLSRILHVLCRTEKKHYIIITIIVLSYIFIFVWKAEEGLKIK